VRKSFAVKAPPVRDAIERASSLLGNTPTIARNSYIDPRVIAEYERGRVIATAGVREIALLELLVEDGA
jgi:DNA topoisomerase-1